MTGYSFRKDIAYVPLASISDEIEQREGDKRWKWPSIGIIFWIISLILVGVVYLTDLSQLQSLIKFNAFVKLAKFPELPQKYNSLNGYVINTPGCRIPEMNPNDSSVRDFIFKPNEIICKNGLPPLFESNLTSLFMITENLPFYNITNTSNVYCCYKEFWREEPSGKHGDTQIRYSENCTTLNVTASNGDKEFIKVICIDNEDKEVYKDYFTFVPLKREVERHKKGIKPNILVLGLDAVSRVNLHRQLPITYNYLSKELDAVELLGYNKVADNTFPNLIPVLTGMSQSELEKSCWPNSNSRFDNCPFVFHNFSKNNYVTALGEDCASIGIFNYQKKGFIKQPTDYYYTSFNRLMETDIGDYKDFNCVECVGPRQTYKVTLDYIRKFALKMDLESLPYFGFFWSSALSHDYLNRPALGDLAYHDMLNNLKENGHLDNTILIFMSDHGIRWGEIRQTYQGQMEERLPFVFIVLPRWFKEKYPTAVKNLNKNARRLTTPFDLHETLNNILDLNSLENNGIIFNNVSRGYSLFTEISPWRTCEDAEIDSHWCTCQQSIEVSINDSQVIAAAEFAVHEINSELHGYAQCATLAKDSILNARVLYYDSEHFTGKKSVRDYTITMRTVPGDGVFEVTVRYKENQPQVLPTQKPKRSVVDQWSNFTITGTVSRLNLYGKQSYCITDFHLKLYCYCKSL